MLLLSLALFHSYPLIVLWISCSSIYPNAHPLWPAHAFDIADQLLSKTLPVISSPVSCALSFLIALSTTSYSLLHTHSSPHTMWNLPRRSKLSFSPVFLLFLEIDSVFSWPHFHICSLIYCSLRNWGLQITELWTWWTAQICY